MTLLAPFSEGTSGQEFVGGNPYPPCPRYGVDTKSSNVEESFVWWLDNLHGH
jgi:hypothetical protein